MQFRESHAVRTFYLFLLQINSNLFCVSGFSGLVYFAQTNAKAPCNPSTKVPIFQETPSPSCKPKKNIKYVYVYRNGTRAFIQDAYKN
jgi:hypothetical protein